MWTGNAAFILLMLSAPIYIIAGHCPSGWFFDGVTCYKFVLKGYHWQQAWGLCKELGGQLAVIDTPEKSAIITAYLKLHKDWWTGHGFWAAGYLDDDNVWKWSPSNGSPHAMSYTNWAAGQPSSGSERCLEINTLHHETQWNDLRCNAENIYNVFPICEKKAAVFDAQDQLIG